MLATRTSSNVAICAFTGSTQDRAANIRAVIAMYQRPVMDARAECDTLLSQRWLIVFYWSKRVLTSAMVLTLSREYMEGDRFEFKHQ